MGSNWIFIIVVILESIISSIDAFCIVQQYRSSTTNWKSISNILKGSVKSSDKNHVYIEGIASAGLKANELSVALDFISSSLDSEFGLDFVTTNMRKEVRPVIPKTVPGALGRVLLLSIHNVAEDWDENDDRLDPFHNVISQCFDSLIVGGEMEHPVLVSIIPNFKANKENEKLFNLSSVIENEVIKHQLREPMVSSTNISDLDTVALVTQKVEIDGAMIPDPYSHEETWDTSNIVVLDNFVDTSLRKRLLDVVNKRHGNYTWDDKENGPDTERWERGGLMDTIDGEGQKQTCCWGLTEEAINDLCFGQHSSIMETEKKIAELFYPNFVVSRLPESVMGPCVSPLTANAPTFGDEFSYHIDADPNQAPPSPWTDVFGRYFNRGRGKPRFVSCLIYLNDEWNDSLGAPTQFYDPPTESIYHVFPRPGRCVIMDQDVTHRVVPPNDIAGAMPRYSLVWKLILHPVEEGQSMEFKQFGETSLCVGSANKN